MDPVFELFDHTADLGIRVRAPDLAGLIAPAALGLYAAIGELTPAESGLPWQYGESGGDAPLLLRNFLDELLVYFERDKLMLIDPRVERFDESGLAVVGKLAVIDVVSSNLDREVKAITYHELAIRPIPGGLEATVIVDI